MNEQTESKPQRYWFSPNPFIRKMELFSVLPLLLSLATSLLNCSMYVSLRSLPYDNYDRVGYMIGIGIVSLFSLGFFVVANIFAVVAFFHMDYPNSPKGLVSKILYRSVAIFIPIWLLILF